MVPYEREPGWWSMMGSWWWWWWWWWEGRLVNKARMKPQLRKPSRSKVWWKTTKL